MRPTATASTVAAMMPSTGPGPFSAMSTAVNPMTAGIDRSMPRIMSTRNWPIVTMPMIDACRIVLRRVDGV